jgi:hypothetical protein
MTTDTITENRVITIGYGMSLEAMIAAGNYDGVDSDITSKRFPVTTTGIIQFEPKVFHFNHLTSSDVAVAAIKADDRQHPWEPAKIEHLLSYGARNPEEQRQYSIIGLGSVSEVDRYRCVPRLYAVHATRRLGLAFGWWNENCRFLAVRTLSSGS